MHAAALVHARAEYPREACGLIVQKDGEEHYFPCKNISQDPEQFALCPEDYAYAEDRWLILGVVHSHCDRGPEPSRADRAACDASGIPWYIVSVPSGQWELLRPSGMRAKYLGRPFIHGVFDCYALIRDWYQGERRIELPDFMRDAHWWRRGENLFMENFQAAGFRPLRDDERLDHGDVILMQIGSRVANHGAVYIGRDLILHHLSGKLSGRDIYGGYWRKVTRLILRYEGGK